MIIQNLQYPEVIVVRAVEPRERFVVHVTFTDGTERDIDLEPYLWGPVFEPIRNDLQLFRRVYVDPETETLTWPNGADIAPETLYYVGSPPWSIEKTHTPRLSQRRPRFHPARTKPKARARARAAVR